MEMVQSSKNNEHDMENTIFRGVVRGKNIELEEAPPFPDGEAVTVEIFPQRASGEGLRASAGAWADAGEELDQWLEELYRARHSERGTNRP
jgi:hypothetical protein